MLGMHGEIWQAEGCEGEALLIQAKWKTAQPRDSWLPHFLYNMTFPRKWTPLSDPLGRKRGGCSWSSDITEREEGVTAIEVTQWLELQDTSVKQRGRGSSSPWNPDHLKETTNRAALLAQGSSLQQKLQEYSVWAKVLHRNTFWGKKSNVMLM